MLTVNSFIYIFSLLVRKVVLYHCPKQAYKFHLQITGTCGNATFADVDLPAVGFIPCLPLESAAAALLPGCHRWGQLSHPFLSPPLLCRNGGSARYLKLKRHKHID